MSNFEENRKFRLRVKYVKKNNLAYLSHLELIRSLESAIRRSGLVYCVTQGFSPHMKISFGPALGVGIESESEIFDIYLKEYVSCDKALQMLQAVCVKDLMPISCEYIDNSELAVSNIYGQTKYMVIFDGKLDNFVIPKKINVIKKKKNKTIEVDNYLCGKVHYVDDEYNKIIFILQSTNKGSLKPEIFINELLVASKHNSLQIKKIKKL